MDWLRRCQVLADEGDWARVVNVAGEWVKAAPEEVLARVVLGEALGHTGRYEAAEGALRQATEMFPGGLDAWVILGSVYYQQGKQALVEQVYQVLGGINPDTARLFYDKFIAPEANRYRPAFNIKVVTARGK